MNLWQTKKALVTGPQSQKDINVKNFLSQQNFNFNNNE